MFEWKPLVRSRNPTMGTSVDELKSRADRYGCVEFTPFVPEYMEKLYEVHESLRGRISTHVAFWDKTIISALERARNTFGEELSILGVVAEESEVEDHEEYHRTAESASLFSAPIDWRKQLEAKKRDVGKLSVRYVSGRVDRAH
jgi:hypothetical protein